MPKLPSILEREPLVEAIFEVRLAGCPGLADIVPGVLFSHISPKPQFERLPPADIPLPIRAANPTLVHAPLRRMDWGEFSVSIGDANVVIGCKLPYPKWPRFKAGILQLLEYLAEADISGQIERYSLKYVNIIRAEPISAQIDKINMSVQIGDVEVTDDHASIQVHKRDGDIIHIITVMTGAQGTIGQEHISGIVVDIDSIQTSDAPDFKTFVGQLSPGLENLRMANKIKFFACLKDQTVQEMGPHYDA